MTNDLRTNTEERDYTRQQAPSWLFRVTAEIFKEPQFSMLLGNVCNTGGLSADERAECQAESFVKPLESTEAMGINWLKLGGKRLRPLVAIAAYAAAKRGGVELARDESCVDVPETIKRVALAIEALHKASLVHDDIEDDDAFRYGRLTLHRQHGVATAINVGDYLVGLGYRLAVGQADALGAECTADVLSAMASAHLEICRGQGAELAWRESRKNFSPPDALAVYALKTAPAFEAALYSGLRIGGASPDRQLIKRFSTCIGEAYQIINDLKDWEVDFTNKIERGGDIIGRRPTLLHAFASAAGGRARLADAVSLAASGGDGAAVGTVHEIYSSLGAFEKAESLLANLKTRGLEIAAGMNARPLRGLLEFLVQIVLR